MQNSIRFCSYLAHFFSERETLRTKVVGKSKHTFYFIFPENRSVYEIMWKNVVEPERPQMTIYKHFTLGAQGYKETLAECVTAFLLQQWLHECATLLLMK